MTDFVTARDDILALFKTAWDAGAQAVVGSYEPQIVWWMNEPATLPPPDKFWCRVSLQVVKEGNVSIGAAQGGGAQKYETAGLVFVQVFGPMTGDSQVGDKLTKLALIARNAFRGKSTSANVWFLNSRIQPLVPDGGFQRINAVAEYHFYEVA